MKKILSVFVLVIVGLSSCNDWLDVKPQDEEREDNLFQTETGFKDALSGCYSSLASSSIYGERLTMTDIECLANQWAQPNETYQQDGYYLHMHQYDNDAAKDAIDAIYTGLFNVVAQANIIIKHATGSDGDNLTNQDLRNVVAGEAYALRALCQMDVLRLFGQMPQNAKKQVSLPYSEVTDINILPQYYNFKDYVAKLESDLDNAEKYLLLSDPYSGSSTTSSVSIASATSASYQFYTNNRALRLNYWAVRALRARLYLYLGDDKKAHDEALAVINAKKESTTVFSLSTQTDFAGTYYNTPSENIFGLSVDGLGSYAVSVLGGDATVSLFDTSSTYHLYQYMYNQLFESANKSSDVRYISQWEMTKSSSITYPTIKKYFYDTSGTTDLSDLLTRREVVPIVRLSEMYLIALETATDLAEANSLYQTYMRARNVIITTKFTSLTDVNTVIYNEYLMDFYAEGQMFYYYKRTSAPTTKWVTNQTLSDEQYVIPLPTTEYDPATNQ